MCIVGFSLVSEKSPILSAFLIRYINMPQKAVIYMYVYRQDISMNNRPNSIILLHKTGAHCWEADDNGAKLRDVFLIFKTPKLGSGACDQ